MDSARGSVGSRLPILSLLAIVLAVPATSEWRYRVDGHGGQRHVEERQDHTTIVEEEGPTAGIDVIVARQHGPWVVALDTGLARAELNYDGATQTGAPFATDSGWKAIHLGAAAGRRFEWANGGRWYGRLEYQQRQRDIASGATVTGLNETYRTLWLGVGLKSDALAPATIELDAACAVSSKVDVRFDSALGSTIDSTLDDAKLTVKDHCRAGVAAVFEIGRIGEAAVSVRPFVTWERYPQTPDERLTVDGSAVGRVFLPATEFIAYGLTLGIGSID